MIAGLRLQPPPLRLLLLHDCVHFSAALPHLIKTLLPLMWFVIPTQTDIQFDYLFDLIMTTAKVFSVSFLGFNNSSWIVHFILIILLCSTMAKWRPSMVSHRRLHRRPAMTKKTTIIIINNPAWHALIKICNPSRNWKLIRPPKSMTINWLNWWNELVTILYRKMDNESLEDLLPVGLEFPHAKALKSSSEKSQEICSSGNWFPSSKRLYDF